MSEGRHVRRRRDAWTWAGIAIVAIAAAVMSFDALRRLAERAGVATQLGWLLPLAIDAAVIVATRAWLAAPAGNRVTRYARAVALASLALSVAGNATEHAMAAYALATPWWVVVAVSAVPPVMLGATAHLAALVVADRRATDTDQVAPPRSAPSTERAASADTVTPMQLDAPPKPAKTKKPGDTPNGGKAALMRATFERYRDEGRLDQLTGAELARAADAAPSLGRRYLKEWRDALDIDTSKDQEEAA